MSLRLVSWNILQGGGKRAAGIAEALHDLAPDILCVQEFRRGKSAPILLDAMTEIGLEHQHLPDSTASKNVVMLASRYAFEAMPWDSTSLDDDLAIEARIEIGKHELTLLVGHLPHKARQPPYFHALLEREAYTDEAALIIGDINCGIPFEDSDTKTFDHTHLFQALLQQGWIDAWRSRNPTAREFSWISHRGNGYRYDHCLTTPAADALVETVSYRHDLRECGLSDHSALVIDLSLECRISR